MCGEVSEPHDDGCEFCEGTCAAERDEPRGANPYPRPPDDLRERGTLEYVETPWYLWDAGWSTERALREGRMRRMPGDHPRAVVIREAARLVHERRGDRD